MEAGALGHSNRSVHSVSLWLRSCGCSLQSVSSYCYGPSEQDHHGQGAHLRQSGLSLLRVLKLQEEDDAEEQIRDPPEAWHLCRPPHPRAEGQRSCWQAGQGAGRPCQYSSYSTYYSTSYCGSYFRSSK